MKKIINGRRYDTDSAKYLAEDGDFSSDEGYWREVLYRKNTGEYFLYGTGGPATKYAEPDGVNSWIDGERIMPMSLDEAKAWAKGHIGDAHYDDIFGMEEDLTKRTVTFSLTEATIEKISQTAVRNGCSKSEVIERVMALIQL